MARCVSQEFAIYEDPTLEHETDDAADALTYNDHADGLTFHDEIDPDDEDDEHDEYYTEPIDIAEDDANMSFDSADIPVQSIETRGSTPQYSQQQQARKPSSLFSSIAPSSPPFKPRQSNQYPPSPNSLAAAESRRISALTTTSSISSFPESIQPGFEVRPHSHTPMKGRPPFRSPSSVRALQMASPAMSMDGRRSTLFEGKRSEMGESRGGTPGRTSIRSGSHISVQSGYERRTPQRTTPQPQGKRHPLVLLHITLLPPQPPPYPLHILAAALPPHMMENIDLLRTKATDTVLTRGILVPHPREDYELLEERLLESLELIEPRVTRCGHFYIDPDNDENRASPSIADSEDTLRNSDHTHLHQLKDRKDSINSLPDLDEEVDEVCTDCGNALKLNSRGAGAGKRRWDVRFYAANGLMRAGAWTAAWSEMERVDVEVSAWIPEELRRDMDRMIEEEEEERERAREEEEAEREREREEAARAEAARMEAKARHAELWRQRESQMRAMGSPGVQMTPQPTSQPASRRSSGNEAAGEIPLSTLLRNYVYLLLVSRRNVAIIALSCLVVLLSVRLHEAPATGVAALSHSPPAVLEYSQAIMEQPSSTAISVDNVSMTTQSPMPILPVAPAERENVVESLAEVEVPDISSSIAENPVPELHSLNNDMSPKTEIETETEIPGDSRLVDPAVEPKAVEILS